MKALVALILALAAAPAFACAVCGSSRAPNDWAFGLTTLILSVTPPVLFGVFVFVIVRAHRRRQRDEAPPSIAPPAE